MNTDKVYEMDRWTWGGVAMGTKLSLLSVLIRRYPCSSVFQRFNA